MTPSRNESGEGRAVAAFRPRHFSEDFRARAEALAQVALLLNNRLRVSPHRAAAPPAGHTDRHVALVAHGLHIGDEFTIDAIQVRRLEP